MCGGGGAGRSGRERDTESKTRTPHKDVGNGRGNVRVNLLIYLNTESKIGYLDSSALHI